MYEKCADEGIKGISLGSDVTKWANEFSARSAGRRAGGSDKKMMKKRVRVERRLSTSDKATGADYHHLAVPRKGGWVLSSAELGATNLYRS